MTHDFNPAVIPPGAVHLGCSFCGKQRGEVRFLICGPAVYICDRCVDLCLNILDEVGEPSVVATALRTEVDRLQKGRDEYREVIEAAARYPKSRDWPPCCICGRKTAPHLGVPRLRDGKHVLWDWETPCCPECWDRVPEWPG
jgi:hypothetical protein